MISDKIVITDKVNECDGLEEAIDTVQRSAEYAGYTARDAAEIRALAVDLVAGCAAILDVFTGTLWVETDDTMFHIMLQMEGTFTQTERDRLVALTPDNENTPPKGFFAKLGALLSDTFSGEYFYPYAMASDPESAEVIWSNAQIAEMMAENERTQDPVDKAIAKEAKETLDCAADDVQVTANANRVLVRVSRALPQ